MICNCKKINCCGLRSIYFVLPLVMVVCACSGDDEDETEVSETDIFEATGTINGYEYVDLGLSVKWARVNIGASSIGDYGDYYAWGEIETKETYTSDNYSLDDIDIN